ncbi:NADH-quinone oxidoreductase subunit N [Myxococcota bacterium]|nr:NADH-quinone oxidoreductase subunit N [Myxococcota bacterium]MCZ7617093.1 NADH-quinone oxidoreductase subunit N [Myxococcota bacterium]
MIDPPVIDLSAIAPIGSVTLGAIAVLLAEVFLTRRRRVLGREMSASYIAATLVVLSTIALAIAAYTAMAGFASGASIGFLADVPGVRLDRFSSFAIALISLAAMLSCWLSLKYLAEVEIDHGEFYALLLLSTAGMMVLVAATDFLMLFLGLELMSIPIYVLAGFDRRNLRSNESALKYFLVGSFASGLLLYGIALVYGVTGTLDFAAVRAALPPGNPLALVGIGLLIIGFAFKVSAVPFHQWTPDVYEGAPVAVTAYMSVTVKLAAFAALLRVVVGAFGDVLASLQDVFWMLSLLTILVGNVMATIQTNVKRLLAYSSVAHAGYLLMGFATGTAESYSAVLFYLLGYAFMNLGAFAVLVSLSTGGKDCERIEDLAGLARSRPGLAALLTLFAISLAGIPGTVGFTAKFFLFKASVDAGLIGLTIVAVFGSLVSVFYYLRLPVLMYMHEPGAAKLRPEAATLELLVLGLCAAAVVLLGLFPIEGPSWLGLSTLRALDWARTSAQFLF